MKRLFLLISLLPIIGIFAFCFHLLELLVVYTLGTFLILTRIFILRVIEDDQLETIKPGEVYNRVAEIFEKFTNWFDYCSMALDKRDYENNEKYWENNEEKF